MSTPTRPYLSDKLTSLDNKLKASEYTEAFGHATEASASIIDGIGRLAKGDTRGGATALLEGAGLLSKVGAALGPAGAAAGGIISLLTGIIAAIMELLNPEKESLEERIEQIIKDEDLKSRKADLGADEDGWIAAGEVLVAMLAYTRQAYSEARHAGRPFVFDAATMFLPEDTTKRLTLEERLEYLRGGVSWEYLEAHTNYQAHVDKINGALDFLDEMKPPYTEEWNALLDQALGYMFRMWVSLHGMLGLIDEVGHGMFVKMRGEIGRQFKERVDKLSYRAQNNCQIYSRWHSGSPDSFDYYREQVYQRMGVRLAEWTPFEQVSTFPVRNFAVSSGGTIFGGTRENAGPGRMARNALRAGRRGSSWQEAKDSPQCDQVFIGEVPDIPHIVIVACTEEDGRSLFVGSFNEAPQVGDAVDEWTPNAARWTGWTSWKYPFTIASVAVVPAGNKQYSLHALGLHDDLSAQLYRLDWGGDYSVVEGFAWNKDEVTQKALGLNLAGDDRWADHTPYSCAISTAPLAVQLGNLVKVKEGAEIKEWDLRSAQFLWDGDLRAHQGKFYSDGTFVISSNRGVHMRYWDPAKGRYEWVNDPTNEGEPVQKMPLRNGGLFRALQDKFGSLE